MTFDATARDSAERPLRATHGSRKVARRGSEVWRRRWLLPPLIAFIALAFRLVPLNRYITPDEPGWAYRSIRFYQALADRDLDALPTTGHPGVTTMWLGSLGVEMQRWLDSEQASTHLEWLDGLAELSPESPAAYRHLAFLIPAGRVVVALVNSLGLLGVYFLANRLWAWPVALLATLMLTLDAFLAGHSGLLHPAGLFATTVILSILAALFAVCSGHRRRFRYRWIAASGVLAGLAALTEAPGGLLFVFVGFLLMVAWLTHRISLRQALAALTFWVLTAGLTFLLLYPALWTDAVGILRRTVRLQEHQIKDAITSILGGQGTLDPDVTFYPVVWLLRSSPLVTVGLLIALIGFARRPGWRRFSIAALLALALGFGLSVALAGGQQDRYVLPAMLPLTFVAGLGWIEIGRWAHRKLMEWETVPNLSTTDLRIPILLIVALVVIQLLVIRPFLSTPLGYFNPLFGGSSAALERLKSGWGEGLGAIAHWLNQDPDAEELIVAVPSIPSFATIFVGQTVPLDGPTVYQADYVVHTPRQGVPPLFGTPEAYDVVFEMNVGGISHTSLIRNPALDEQVTYLGNHARSGDLVVLDAGAALAQRYNGPADLAVLADARSAAQVSDRLDALVSGRAHVWYVAWPDASPITGQRIKDQLACRGQLASFESVGGVVVWQFALTGSRACDATIPQATPIIVRVSDTLALVDALLLNESAAWPEQVGVVVRWEALRPPGADFNAVLLLRDDSGRIWVEEERQIHDTDLRRAIVWSTGDWSDQNFNLALPPAIPPGGYTVELIVSDPVGGQENNAQDTDGSSARWSVSLGKVTITPPPRPPTSGEVIMAERLDPPLGAGPLSLLGYAPPPDRVTPGDEVSLALFWQASAAPDDDFVLRWRLFSGTGAPAVEETIPLSPYSTARWRAQELVQVRYDLPISSGIPAGNYSLAVNILDSSGDPLWPGDVVLTQLEVLSRE